MISRPALAIAMTAMMSATGFLAVGAFAQQPNPPQPPTPPTQQSARPLISPDDRAALLDARIAAVKAGLRLTPDQERLWPAAEQAVREGFTKRAEMMEKMRGQTRPTDPIEGMRRGAEAAIARGEAMRKIADAVQPLYASLSDDQKRRLTMLTHHGRAGMGRAGMGGAGMGAMGERMRGMTPDNMRSMMNTEGRTQSERGGPAPGTTGPRGDRDAAPGQRGERDGMRGQRGDRDDMAPPRGDGMRGQRGDRDGVQPPRAERDRTRGERDDRDRMTSPRGDRDGARGERRDRDNARSPRDFDDRRGDDRDGGGSRGSRRDDDRL